MPDHMLSQKTNKQISIDSKLLDKRFWQNNYSSVVSILKDISISDNVETSKLCNIFLSITKEDFIINKYVTPKNKDFIIVLGHVLNKDATPSEELIYRLEATLKAFNGNSGCKIITSGDGETLGIKESELMKKWLIDKGVPEKSIIAENKSKDTVQNLSYSTEILVNNNAKNVILITGESHIARSYMLLKSYLKEKDLNIESFHFSSNDPNNSDVIQKEKNKVNESFLLFKDLGRILGIWDYQNYKIPPVETYLNKLKKLK